MNSNLDPRLLKRQVPLRITGVAGVLYVDHVVPLGCSDDIIVATGSHDGVAAHDVTWSYIFGGTEYVMTSPVSLAVGPAKARMYAVMTMSPKTILLRYGFTLRFNVATLGGGEHALLDLLLERSMGEDLYAIA